VDALIVLGGLIQGLAVVCLLLGPVRKYALVAAYCALQLGTSIAEFIVLQELGKNSHLYRVLFWTDEIVLDVLLFLVLILLTYRAMDGRPAQQAMSRILGAITVIVMLLPFVLFKGPFVKTTWYYHTSQLLNFGAAILNLGLWTALLGSRHRDAQVLMVSAGFGIVATGVAISFGLPILIGGAVAHGRVTIAVDLVFMLAHMAGTLILCRAFQPSFGGAAPTVRVGILAP
jgi:hypothetical protein